MPFSIERRESADGQSIAVDTKETKPVCLSGMMALVYRPLMRTRSSAEWYRERLPIRPPIEDEA